MGRYEERFYELKKKKEKAFIPFVVLGDPDYATSREIIKVLLNHADALELGIPFSDPIADGKTIQAADVRALSAGMNTDRAFELIKSARKMDNEIPIGLLLYYNLIYQRGIEKFYNDAKNAGVDSIIAADVPVEESAPLLKAAKKFGIRQIFLVAPTTEGRRLEKVLSKCSGFVYLVTLLGVTGARSDLGSETLQLIRRARKHTRLPLCAGFGISKPEHVRAVAKAGADGAIVGSAIEDIIAKNLKNRKRMLNELINFLGKMKQQTKK